VTHPYLRTYPNMEQALGLDESYVIVDRDDWHRAHDPIVLSQRNILSLLYKLTSGTGGSLRKPHGATIVAEPDKVHYVGRQPGQMPPDTELFLDLMEEALETVKRQMQGEDAGRTPGDWPKDPCRNCQPTGDDCANCKKGM
jgi:hypothetical protein